MRQLTNERIFSDSWESESLEQLIGEKRSYYRKLSNDFAKQKVQEEILLLERLLPIVLSETTLLYGEITKVLTTKISEAVSREANAIVIVIPLHECNDESLKVATVNPNRDNPLEGLEISLEAYGRKLEEVPL
ncbi:MAG TPA: hypothetical protein DCF46_10620 [Porphyromonadaceae bacterium]|jgi:hypothetical protein|nr:hypothetical protein [Porphyromonadaceae bacterium]